eukprot:2023922-Prymnesium_polylepis.1
MLRASAARAKVLALGESCRHARVPCRMASQAHGFRERKNQSSTTGEEGMGGRFVGRARGAVPAGE